MTKTIKGYIGTKTYQINIEGYREDMHVEQVESAMRHIKQLAEKDGFNPKDVVFFDM